MTTTDRIREALEHALSLSPVVTRRTMLDRERNAFELGVDYGRHIAQAGQASHP